MKAIITVGMGFGDEGKGATVDFLTRALKADLVVRYSGGAQAGHNVELPDGRRHTFSQFGAGTLAGAKTYLGPRMIISPRTLPPEAEHLQELGIANPMAWLSVHPECLVSTGYHVALNRLRELARGADRHGSCGLGIGETRHYWLRYGQDAIVARDLRDRRTLLSKLALLRDRFLLEMQPFAALDPEWSLALHETLPVQEADELQQAAEGLALSSRLPDAQTAIFEGAQGVLLDEWKGFHPYTTWSTVTADPAFELLEEQHAADAIVLGITRAYTTRHGAGPFPTDDPEWASLIKDVGNPVNDWQGAIRSGPLDLVLLKYALAACPVDGLVVNGLDQLPPRVPFCPEYGDGFEIETPLSLKAQERVTERLLSATPVIRHGTVSTLLNELGNLAPVVITSRGPTFLDRQFTPGQVIF